jgi:uncharacterized protein (UPF0276 family)
MRYQSVSHKVGLGLRPTHYPYLENKPETQVAWFEAVSENYMNSRGRPLEFLMSLRQDYPIALHGVGMNVGATDGVSLSYLQKLGDLIDQVEPFIVSDHLCWSAAEGHHFHDLLPLPFTNETVNRLVDNIDFAQNYLKRPLIFENVSTYIRFDTNEMSEEEFLVEVARRAGCRLLLDLNNVYVNSFNHGFDAKKFIRHIPTELIGQIHLAGPSDEGRYLFDTHSTEVPEPVWGLLRSLAPRISHLPVLIERDEDIPEFNTLEVEVMKAAFILENAYETQPHTAAL